MVDLKPGQSNNAGEFNYGKEGLAKEDAIEATKQDKTRVQGKTTHRVRSRRQDSASGARKKEAGKNGKKRPLECYEMFGTGPLLGHAL